MTVPSSKIVEFLTIVRHEGIVTTLLKVNRGAHAGGAEWTEDEIEYQSLTYLYPEQIDLLKIYCTWVEVAN